MFGCGKRRRSPGKVAFFHVRMDVLRNTGQCAVVDSTVGTSSVGWNAAPSLEGREVGHLLLSQAVAFRTDLLVMGAYGQSKLREWVFGGVTRTVLYEAGLPVLMSR